MCFHTLTFTYKTMRCKNEKHHDLNVRLLFPSVVLGRNFPLRLPHWKMFKCLVAERSRPTVAVLLSILTEVRDPEMSLS
jgi:hypothetical protein